MNRLIARLAFTAAIVAGGIIAANAQTAATSAVSAAPSDKGAGTFEVIWG